MRTRIIPIVLAASFLAVAALIVVPRLTGAGIAVPTATKAACCTAFEPPPPPPPDGDRDFGESSNGGPNVMLLVDSSGSMKEFPRELSWRGFSMGSASAASTQGTCTVATPFKNDTTTYDINDPKYDVPYDNGYVTTTVTPMIDDPPWGLARCTAKQVRPTTDGARDWCMYRPDSYYKFVNGASLTGGTFWDDTDAKTYNANPCAAVSTAGNVILDYNGNLVTADVAACTACLSSKGFYFFRNRYRNSSGTWTNTAEQLVFSGRFLNAFPQKHVIARKVVKDLVKYNESTSTTNSIRFGLTAFQTSSSGGFQTYFRTGDGGRLIVPLGPSCTDTASLNEQHFVESRQAIVDAINAIDTSNAAWPSRYFAFSSNTPLAETLFNIGQYFTEAGTGGLYNTQFGTSWVLPRTGDTRDFRETSAGVVNAAWASGGTNQSFCWTCQQSSVVIVTDGEPNADSNLPSGGTTTPHASLNKDFRYWTNATIDCPACQCDLSYGDTCTLASPIVPSGGNIPNMLHKVAHFLYTTDLRQSQKWNQPVVTQTVRTYTISFGLDASASAPAGDKKAIATLRKTAELGGGLFSNTSSGDELRSALAIAVSDVQSRQSSFSSANANALQTSKTNQVDAYLGRFKQTSSSIWEGHLFAGMVFDEYGQGCDERFPTLGQPPLACGTKSSQNPNMNGDELDGKAVCSGAWVVDRNCDPIMANESGTFKVGTFDDTTHQLFIDSGAPDADLTWDAGAVLSDPSRTGYKSAREGQVNSRRIFTVIDRNSDGKITSSDGLVEFTTDNSDALAPAMGLDQTWCMSLLQKIRYCGASPLPACPAWSDATRALCAKQVIYFIRGYDVLDEDDDHCAGPGSYYNTNGWGSCTTNESCASEATCVAGKCVNNNCTADGEERDRPRDSRPADLQDFWKLGDIFHSSPVLVKPPIDKVTCSYGAFEIQCVPTLFGGSGWRAQSGSCYPPLEKYGSLDAYDAYRANHLARPQIVLVGANDGMLHAFDAGTALTGQAKTLTGGYQYTAGTGMELWGFIPPDLLPRLRHALDAHQYFVDGNTMVRDVWIDANRDGKKQTNEYHTVAVISERGGGTRFTALDVTDPGTPRFMWTFPEGCSDLSPAAAQSWSDFLPRPPPLGPVRVGVTTADAGSCGFEERWIAFLNGGYDPAMIRGRYVAIVDIDTGKPIWRYTDADFEAMRGDSRASMLPVAATVGMSDIGLAVSEKGIFDTDGYFDTATWGDMGGNLFLARMHLVGEWDSSATTIQNWFAARTFELNRRTDDAMMADRRSPFFLMTANMVDFPSRLMTLIGSGNRERLHDKAPMCGPNNVLACCQASCSTVASTVGVSYGAGSCSAAGSFSCNGGLMTFTGASAGCTGSYACGPATQQVTFDSSCDSANTASFAVDASGGITLNTLIADDGTSVSTPTCGPNAPRDCYYGVWAYGIKPEKRFTTLAEARAFEENRFTDVPYAGCGSIGTCSVVDVTQTVVKASGITGVAAKAGDPGWKYCYGKACPTEGCTGTWCDERTVSQPVGTMGCIAWSTFRPTGTTGDPCAPKAGVSSALAYAANFLTGLPSETCSMFQETVPGDIVYGRATMKGTFAPPPSPASRATFGAAGVQLSSVRTDDSGTEKHVFGKTHAVVAPLYRVEVPRVVHTCRHVDKTTCE